MLILAIDTALDACAAGVLDTESTTMLAQQSLAMKRGHAEALMPLIGRVMIAAQMEFRRLDRIAVTVGPGSFTGLRVGVAAARLQAGQFGQQSLMPLRRVEVGEASETYIEGSFEVDECGIDILDENGVIVDE